MIGGDLRLDFPVAVALALVPAALTFWWRRKADPALRYADTALLPWAVIGDHTRTRAWRVWAWWLGWLALAIAAAGPSRPAGDSEPGVSASARGALVIVVLDASDPSTDRFGPSFHEQARIALADLTAQMRGARFALIAYAADAGVLLPETIDPALVAHFADVAVDVFLSIDAEDPAACCELAGPELDACTAAGCWDVEPATSYGDRCEILEVRDTCFPAVWDGTCFGAIKPDDCQLSPGSEVIYREVAPGEYVFLVDWELCVDGVPGWSHCFVDPEIDPPGCLCACA